MAVTLDGKVTEEVATSILSDLAVEGEGPVEFRIIDSPGGDLSAGLSIYNAMIARGNVEVIVERFAGSVASVIAFGGGKPPKVYPGAMIMIHNARPAMGVGGDQNDLRQAADIIEQYSQGMSQIYSQYVSIDRPTIEQLMDKETAMNAETSIKLGFASEIVQPSLKAVAEISNYMSLKDNILKAMKVKAEDEEPDEEPKEEMVFSEAQMNFLKGMVADAVAAATKATEARVEKNVGTVVADILDKVVSDSAAPGRSTVVTEAEPEKVDGFTAFGNRMKAITEERNKSYNVN